MGDEEEAIRDAVAVQVAEEKSEEDDCPTELAMFQGGAVRWAHIKAARIARNYSGEPE